MRLVRHSVFNLLGLGLPLVVAVFSIPLLIEALGAARFGILTLIWAVVSYFGLFDLGLGRALTQQLAVALAKDERDRIGPLVATSTVLMAALGIFATILMAALAPSGVGMIKSVPDQKEAVNAVLVMALAMPAIVLTSGFRGILEARNAFGVINLIRLPMGLFTFLGPVLVVASGFPSLVWISAVLVAGRVIACAAHALCALRYLKGYRGNLSFDKSLLKPLCVSGGWLTLSNVISPFMGYVDRFIIGAIVSAAAVAYYTTPQEIVTKIWIVPGALTAVLFPAFSAKLVNSDEGVRKLFSEVILCLFLVLIPITSALAVFAKEILSLWVGWEMAEHGELLMQIFAIGILVNCLAHVPFTLIQSAGMPRVTALIHCAELPFFLLLLWWLTASYGVEGAAVAWIIRMCVDTLAMFFACCSIQGWPQRFLFSRNLIPCVALAALAFVGVLVEQLHVRVFLCLATSALVVCVLHNLFVRKRKIDLV